MKRVLLLVIFLIASQVQVWGMQFIGQEDLFLDQDELVDEDFYIAGEKITFLGNALQDLFVVASARASISGTIVQDLNVGAVRAEINAKVGDDLRVAASEMVISGNVTGSTLLFGYSIFIKPQSVFESDVRIWGDDVQMAGKANGNLYIRGREVLINGIVAGDLKIEAKSIVLGRKARILGRLDYISSQEIQTTLGAVVQNQPNWQSKPDANAGAGKSGWKNFFTVSKIFFRITLYLGLLAVGCIFVLLLPHATRKYAMVMRYRTWASLGWGALTIVAITILLLILVISLLGIPVAIVLGFLSLTVMLAAGIGMGYMIGILIIKPKVSATGPSIGAFVLGFTLLIMLGLIPILGNVVNLIVIVFGFGAIWLVPGFEEPQMKDILSNVVSVPEPASVPAAKESAEIQSSALPIAESETVPDWKPAVPAFKKKEAGRRKDTGRRSRSRAVAKSISQVKKSAKKKVVKKE